MGSSPNKNTRWGPITLQKKKKKSYRAKWYITKYYKKVLEWKFIIDINFNNQMRLSNRTKGYRPKWYITKHYKKVLEWKFIININFKSKMRLSKRTKK